MAFADPQSVTINAVAQTLPRVSSGIDSGSFQKDDASVKLTVSSTYGRRNRRTIRLDHRKIAADPLMPSTNTLYTMSCYIVIDVPPVGYTVAEQKQIVDGLTGYATASSGARVTQILGGEN
jgi:hypothetical protein